MARKTHKGEIKKAKAKLTDTLRADSTNHMECIVCQHKIKTGQAYRRIMPDAKVAEWRFYHYPDCGPGTQAWFEFHPSHTAELMLKGKEVKREKRLRRRERRVSKQIQPTLIEKGEITMSKKEEKKVAKRGEHLKPMKPVIVPQGVIKKQSKEVQALLKELTELKERSSADGTRIRKALRKAGFKLSDYREEGPGAKAAPKKETKKEKVPSPKVPTEEEED